MALSMKLRTGLTALVVALSWFAAPTDSMGQGARPPATLTAEELEVYQLYSEDRLLTARRRAEEILQRNSSSVIGHFVVGAVYRRAEGALGNAIYHLGRAREIYETRWGTGGAGGAAWQLHQEILFTIQLVAGEMEEWDYQLHILEYHDMLYDPDLYAEHAWPLIQLGRHDLARQFATIASRSRHDFQRSLGLNALCAIEGEAQERWRYYEACSAALRNAEERARSASAEDSEAEASVAVHAYNASLAATAVLRFDDAEELALRGTRRLEHTPANPWRLLTRLYLDQGRMDDAVEALREMQRWRQRQPPHLRGQDRAETDAVFATVLLVAGVTSVGERAITRAIERPDRRGLTSSRAEQSLGGHALLRRAIVSTRLAREAEENSTRGFFARLTGSIVNMTRRFGLWGDEERVVSVLGDEEILRATLRAYVQGGLEPVPVWLIGDLIQVLGPGVVNEALDEVEGSETLEGLLPYQQALRSEIALERGDERRSFNWARASLGGLPSREALLRARVAAIGAEAARRLGNEREAAALFEEALRMDGGVIRRLGLAIPVAFRDSSRGRVGGELVDVMTRSPRFRHQRGGLRVQITGDNLGIRLCLLGRRGARIRCTETVSPRRPTMPSRTESRDGDDGDHREDAAIDRSDERETRAEFISRVAMSFHDTAFAMPVQLTTTDVNSLDGRIEASEEASRRRLRGVLDELIEQSSDR